MKRPGRWRAERPPGAAKGGGGEGGVLRTRSGRTGSNTGYDPPTPQPHHHHCSLLRREVGGKKKRLSICLSVCLNQGGGGGHSPLYAPHWNKMARHLCVLFILRNVSVNVSVNFSKQETSPTFLQLVGGSLLCWRSFQRRWRGSDQMHQTGKSEICLTCLFLLA